jgi:glycosyltransferase involved in cell wall biosynthesis
MKRALVICPVPIGHGGLGGAARQPAIGFRSQGLEVVEVSLDAPVPLAVRATHRRPLRRFPALGRGAVRRTVLRATLQHDRDIAWSVPGFLPDRGNRVLHCATFHPYTVREEVERARRRIGGGRGFLTQGEARRLSGEIDAADVVRVESRAVAEDLEGRGIDARKIVYVRPGVDAGHFRPGDKPDKLSVAFVGTFSVWKGIDVLLETAAKLQGIADVRAIGGPVDSFTRRLVANAPLRRASDVTSLLASSHALLLPSVSDGFGYVVLEAMASGAVPFVTPTVGAAELVEQIAPQLVIPAEDYAEAVPELLRSLPMPELARRSRAIAEGLSLEQQATDAIGQVLAKFAPRP